MRFFIAGLLALLVMGCSEPDIQFQIPTQNWDDTVIEVQSRPTPVRPGMNEFLVIATLERGKPVHNLVVSLRGSESLSWQQAIQDGHSGVYRKAVNIPESSSSLYVRLRKKRSDEQHELVFDLRPRDKAEK
ncbi:hypothetical protein ACFL2V_15545 [Pseudomonadota bacterium]